MHTHVQAEAPRSFSGEDRVALEALYSLGHWLLSEERYSDAATVYRVMLRAAPTDERGWLGLGVCHEKLGQPQTALELYGGGAVAAGPSARCHLARFRILWDLDRFAEAEEAIAEAEELGDSELQPQIERERRARS